MRGIYIYVTPFFPSPESWRGSYGYDFVYALQKVWNGRVIVVVPGAGSDYRIGGIPVYRFPVRMLSSNVFPFLFSGYNSRSFLRKIKEIGDEMGWSLADVSICHGNTANFLIYPLSLKAVSKSCVTVLHHHDPQSFGLGLGVFRHMWLYNMMMFPVLKRLHGQIDCHVFVSEMARRSFLSAPDAGWSIWRGYRKQMMWLPYKSVIPRHSIVLHNGVRTDLFNPFGRTPHTRVTIGCVANFIDWKDQMTLLRAIVEIRDKRLLKEVPHIRFVGTGPCLDVCKNFVVAQKLSAVVSFETEVRHEELPEFYKNVDLFVLPSYFEGFGCVFTESWACGTPFITCEGQGMDDVVADDVRELWLCRQRDERDLAMKIVRYIKNPVRQELKAEIDIDKLVPEFVRKLEGL